MARRLGIFALLLCACGDDGGSSNDTGESTGSGSGSNTMSTSTTASTTQTTTTETTTADTSSESSNDTQTEECPTRHACLPPAPEGWTGPITTHIQSPDAPVIECPEGFAAGEGGLFDIQVPEFDCSCNCEDPPVGPTCAFEIEFNTGFMCNGDAVQTTVAAEDECVEYTLEDVQSVSVTDTISEGQCGDATYDPPTAPTWERRIDACVPEVGDACSEGQCVPLPPAPFVGRMCIVHEGEAECPDEGPYDVPFVLHDGADDTRACDCTCEPDVNCTGTLQVHSDATCSSQLSSSTGTCISFLNFPNSARMTAVDMEPECRGVAGKPTGEVTPTGVQTLCCTEA